MSDRLEEKEATNPAYSCPICKTQLRYSPEKRSSLLDKKFWCPQCQREWVFCMLCDSPDFCIKKGGCIRGFKENVEHRHESGPPSKTSSGDGMGHIEIAPFGSEIGERAEIARPEIEKFISELDEPAKNPDEARDDGADELVDKPEGNEG